MPRVIRIYLKNENYAIYKYYSAREALAFIENEEADLAILDIMLPDINGFTLCQKIREKYTYPVIMLTAKDEETDKITGLTLGADDYVTKPFRPLELIARVKAQLQRYKKYTPVVLQNEPAKVLTYKSWFLIMAYLPISYEFINRPGEDGFLYRLCDFNFLHVGEMSFWTPYVILVSVAVEIPLFLILAARSYCKHQVV